MEKEFEESMRKALLVRRSFFELCYNFRRVVDPSFLISDGKDLVKYNESHLKKLPCHIFDPAPLGEGAGVGLLKGVEYMPVPEGSTLDDLVQMGFKHTHAAVGAVVCLRKELSLVKDIPVLFPIDQLRQIPESNSHVICY